MSASSPVASWPAGALSSAKSQVVRAFNYGMALQRRRSSSGDQTYSSRRVAPQPSHEQPEEDPEESWRDSFNGSESELSFTESSYSETPQRTQRSTFNGGLVDFFQTDMSYDRSVSDSNDDEDNRVYRMSTKSMDVV